MHTIAQSKGQDVFLSVFLFGYLPRDVVVRAKDFPCIYFLFLHLLPAHLKLLNLQRRSAFVGRQGSFLKNTAVNTADVSLTFSGLSEVLTRHNLYLPPLCESDPSLFSYPIYVVPYPIKFLLNLVLAFMF